MTITAKVVHKAIDTGKAIVVQAENQADTIVFQIRGEDAALASYYFYLLYKRPGDTVPHVELLGQPTTTGEYPEVSFAPHSYFTAENGTVRIQLLACSAEDLELDTSVTPARITGSNLWQTLPGFIFVNASQLNATETIIEENVLTEYLATFQALKDEAATSATTATNKAQEATGAAGTATTKAGQASDAKDAAAASALVAEGWAKGTQNNTPVGSSSPYHEKNAKYYADEAGEAAQTASGYVETTEGYKDSAKTYASDAKEWAKGQRDDGGTVTHATDNASYYATQAGTAKTGADASALVSEGYAKGTQNGTPVVSGDYYQKNSKYYSEQAAGSATTAGEKADKAAEWAEKDTAVETGKYSAKYWAEFAADTTEDFVRHDDDASLLAATTPINADQLNGHTDTYFAIRSESGSTLELSVNPTTFVITANLKNKAGTTISSASIDLPNESAVTGITYNPTSKTLRFTYQSGQYTDVSIASLISALVTETTFNAHANNSTIHITGDERTAWNTHMSDTTVHTNNTERGVWNSHVENDDIHVTGTEHSAYNSHLENEVVHVSAQEHQDYNSHLENTTVHVTSQNKSDWNAKYDKPSGGIPATDLAASVNTLLGYAENSITYVDTVSA